MQHVLQHNRANSATIPCQLSGPEGRAGNAAVGSLGMRFVVAFVVVFGVLACSAGAAWRPPVGGAVARGFDVGANPFEGGRHRGVDLAAAPGAAVRAPCRGRVVVAGRVGLSGGVVTVLCGRWRVSLLPLASVWVRRGSVVGPGTRVGTLARSRAHAGVHLGVRRDGTRFGYVDPLRFLRPSRPPAPIVVGARRAPRAAPPSRVAAPARPAAAPVAGLAPWPAWVGLALVLAGVRWRGRRRAARRGPLSGYWVSGPVTRRGVEFVPSEGAKSTADRPARPIPSPPHPAAVDVRRAPRVRTTTHR